MLVTHSAFRRGKGKAVTMASDLFLGVIPLPEGNKERVTMASTLPFLDMESLPEKWRSLIIASLHPNSKEGKGERWPWHLPCSS